MGHGGDVKYMYSLVGKALEKGPSVDGKIKLKWILRKQVKDMGNIE